MCYNISFSPQTKFFNNAVHGLCAFLVWTTKSGFFVKTKSEDHSNNRINDNVGQKESQVKVKNVLTKKIEKEGGNRHKIYENSAVFHFLAFHLFCSPSLFLPNDFYVINK